ncbi:MAG: hypothetical protein H0W88_12685 [Parachlamydiaceae bacterium]|nr:hypothetical protein [Parachlamydiaceae bacterium]
MISNSSKFPYSFNSTPINAESIKITGFAPEKYRILMILFTSAMENLATIQSNQGAGVPREFTVKINKDVSREAVLAKINSIKPESLSSDESIKNYKAYFVSYLFQVKVTGKEDEDIKKVLEQLETAKARIHEAEAEKFAEMLKQNTQNKKKYETEIGNLKKDIKAALELIPKDPELLKNPTVEIVKVKEKLSSLTKEMLSVQQKLEKLLEKNEVKKS